MKNYLLHVWIYPDPFQHTTKAGSVWLNKALLELTIESSYLQVVIWNQHSLTMSAFPTGTKNISSLYFTASSMSDIRLVFVWNEKNRGVACCFFLVKCHTPVRIIQDHCWDKVRSETIRNWSFNTQNTDCTQPKEVYEGMTDVDSTFTYS